jgi:excisionase family DNA binding protein
MDKLLLTPVEAASALSISRSKFYELLAAGRVRSVRIDGCRRIPVAALRAYVDDLNSATESDGTLHAA